MENKSFEEIEYLIQEIIIYEIDDDSLDLDCNRSYDDSDRGITFIDLGETILYYGATKDHISNIKKEIEVGLKIDISDVELEHVTISDLIGTCYKKYKEKSDGKFKI